jgi:hypothetical protein
MEWNQLAIEVVGADVFGDGLGQQASGASRGAELGLDSSADGGGADLDFKAGQEIEGRAVSVWISNRQAK